MAFIFPIYGLLEALRVLQANWKSGAFCDAHAVYNITICTQLINSNELSQHKYSHCDGKGYLLLHLWKLQIHSFPLLIWMKTTINYSKRFGYITKDCTNNFVMKVLFTVI
jgi:hypothetical protein